MEKKGPYPLRIPDELRRKVENEAVKNRRSLNAELGLLIEEGLECRKNKAQS